MNIPFKVTVVDTMQDKELYSVYFDDIYQSEIKWEGNLIFKVNVYEDNFPLTFMPSCKRLKEILTKQSRFIVIDYVGCKDYIITRLI